MDHSKKHFLFGLGLPGLSSNFVYTGCFLDKQTSTQRLNNKLPKKPKWFL